jgi:hypothetical protein
MMKTPIQRHQSLDYDETFFERGRKSPPWSEPVPVSSTPTSAGTPRNTPYDERG